MLGAIAGDMIGSYYENKDAPPIGFAPLFHPYCSFTDDTVLTCAVAEWLMTADDLAATLRKFTKAYPDIGFGPMFSEWAHSEALPYGSRGNGSAMRVSPVGFMCKTIQCVDKLATESATVTHNSQEAIAGAVVVARTILAAKAYPSVNKIHYLESQQHGGYDIMTPLANRPKNVFTPLCQPTVETALRCLYEGNNYEEVVRLAVCQGGDTDTTAAIAGSMAEAFYGIPPWIRDEAMRKLDDRLRGIVTKFTGALGGRDGSCDQCQSQR